MTFVLWRYASKICSLEANIKILDGHNFFVFEDIDVILILLYGLFRVESAARDSPAQSRQSARLFLQSSVLGLPHPLTHRRVCSPFL
jgi:hypothetical protein